MALIFDKGFNLAPEGKEVKRCGMVVGVEISGKVIWIGRDIEGADMSFAYNDKTIESIWCETIDKSTVGAITMTFEPFSITGTGGDTATGDTLGNFQAQLLEAVLSKDLSGMVAPAVVAFGFSGEESKWRAKRYESSTWKPQSLGGTGADTVLKFPVNVTFAGAETIGTVDKLPPKDLTATFAAATE